MGGWGVGGLAGWVEVGGGGREWVGGWGVVELLAGFWVVQSQLLASLPPAPCTSTTVHCAELPANPSVRLKGACSLTSQTEAFSIPAWPCARVCVWLCVVPLYCNFAVSA